jgi:hypothetical protein
LERRYDTLSRLQESNTSSKGNINCDWLIDWLVYLDW